MTTYFDWDTVEDNIVEEFDDVGSTVAEYTTEPYLYGDLVSQRRSGQSRFYHFDGLGSTTSVTDSAEVTVSVRSYTVFGETSETGGESIPFQYVGQLGYYLDSVSPLYNVRYRACNPRNGLWLSKDPLFDDSLASYSYVSNSPAATTDPSGLQEESEPIPEPGKKVDIPDWPKCESGCKEKSRRHEFEGKVKTKASISRVDIKCRYGFYMGGYKLYERQDLVSVQIKTGMMRRVVECEKECDSDSDMPTHCSEQRSVPFGPMTQEFNKIVKMGREKRTRVPGKAPVGLPECPEGVPPPLPMDRR